MQVTTITPHVHTFTVWYEVDPAKSPDYKRMLRIKCAPDRKHHYGVEIIRVEEYTLFGWEERPELLDDMTYRPLSWAKTYHELKELMRQTDAQ